jgi:hypothetical protein
MAQGNLAGITHEKTEPQGDHPVDSHENQEADEILVPSGEPGEEPDHQSDDQDDGEVFPFHKQKIVTGSSLLVAGYPPPYGRTSNQ